MKQVMEEVNLLKDQKKVIKIYKITHNLYLNYKQKQNNEEFLKYVKQEEQRQNKSKNEYIRGQHSMFEEKRKAAELDKKKKLQIEKENKIIEEIKIKETIEVINYKNI